jgi:hypothetical protein
VPIGAQGPYLRVCAKGVMRKWVVYLKSLFRFKEYMAAKMQFGSYFEFNFLKVILTCLAAGDLS